MMMIELRLLCLIIGGVLIGVGILVMVLFKREGNWPMIMLFLGLAFVILYFEPLNPPVNLLLLLALAGANAVWVGLVAYRLVPRFAILLGILGAVMTFLYAFLFSFQ